MLLQLRFYHNFERKKKKNTIITVLTEGLTFANVNFFSLFVCVCVFCSSFISSGRAAFAHIGLGSNYTLVSASGFFGKMSY